MDSASGSVSGLQNNQIYGHINGTTHSEESLFEDSRNKDCLICHVKLDARDVVIKVNCCSKNFHAKCLDRNYRQNKTLDCPHCKRILITPSITTNHTNRVKAEVGEDFESFIASRIQIEGLTESILSSTVGLSTSVRQQVFYDIMSDYKDRISEDVRGQIADELTADLKSQQVQEYKEGPFVAIPGNLRLTTEVELSDVAVSVRPQRVIRPPADRDTCSDECKLGGIIVVLMLLFIGIIYGVAVKRD